MELKYFSGKTASEAKEQAAAFFSCSEDDLYVEVFRKGEGVSQWLLLALPLRYEVPVNADGRYVVLYEQSGVYMELYQSRGSGSAANGAQMQKYLQRKNIRQLNPKEVKGLVATGGGRVKIAPPQEAVTLDEDIEIAITPDGLSCLIALLPADEGGAGLNTEGLRQKLQAAGVAYGVKEDVLTAVAMEKEYYKTYVVAEGTPSVSGEDGRIIIHFNYEKTGKPLIQEGGKVDFHALDLFEPVEKGQLLVTRVLPTPGTPGHSVTDSEIPPRPGKDIGMPGCKNAEVNEERTEMYAQRSGMVEYVGGRVTVSDVYSINGDCNLSVGNVDFDGCVKIKGGVISGMTVKATGGISVGGVVEGAELISGGSIDLKLGIQGMDKGKLYAAGSISAMFLERCTAIAGEDVQADAIIHSTVEAGRDIYAVGKRGSIMGGITRCVGKIVAKSLGSVSHSQTEIDLGIVPSKRLRIKQLDDEIENIQLEINKLDLIEAQLEKVGMTMPPENVQRILLSSANSKQNAVERLDQCVAEYETLCLEVENAVNGQVHVLDTAYPGAKISIASGTYKIYDDIHYTTFKYKGGDVVFSSCEYDGKSR